MPLRFTCPACGKELQAPDAMAGRRGSCIYCHAPIIAPAASGGMAALVPSQAPPQSQSQEPPQAPHAMETLPHAVAPGPAAAPYQWSPPPPLSYAPFWKRVAGFVVDSVALWLLYMLLRPLFEALNPWKVPNMTELLQILMSAESGTMSPEQAAGLPDIATALLGITYSLTWTSTLNWLYFALFESSAWQATPGKMAVGAKVTDMSGERIGFGQASVRSVGKGFSSMLCFIGYLMAAVTDKRQALHDFLARTLVLNR